MSVFTMLLMQAAGVTGEPRTTLWHPLDTPDQF